MKLFIALVSMGLIAGCADLPTCPPDSVAAAETCTDETVACQAPGGAPVAGCMLRLQKAPGFMYEAECVAGCPAPLPACGR